MTLNLDTPLAQDFNAIADRLEAKGRAERDAQVRDATAAILRAAPVTAGVNVLATAITEAVAHVLDARVAAAATRRAIRLTPDGNADWHAHYARR